MSKGIVYLVGAGPGDPGLFTLKGRECLQKADVVIYDRLVNPSLLSFAPSGAEIIYAGKSPAGHTYSQREINSLLVDRINNKRIVVRLKGGDPFIFGRGGEEAEVLAENGIPFEIVPGVTSAVAAPAYAGIPVTHRDFTSTVAIITGNEDPSKENSQIEWEKIATGAGTLVFLMGMANLEFISARLIANGRAAGTPVALIRWGTWTEQQVLTGTLADITAKAKEARFANPVVIVVGEVAALRERLQWTQNKPLFGRRALVTRALEQAAGLSSALRFSGAEVIELPAIKIIAPEDAAPMEKAIRELEKYQWIIFTSQNGVKYFFKELLAKGKDVRDLKGIALGAIGPATKGSLLSYGLLTDFMPAEYTASKVAAGLKEKIYPGQKILLPRADIAPPLLKDALVAYGADVDEVVAYRTVVDGRGKEMVIDFLAQRRIDIITFTSSSTVTNFVKMFSKTDLPWLLGSAHIACIGPITAQTARKLGLNVDIVAQEYTYEGLVRAIISRLGIRNQ